jgi:signal transduction histidine kinase
VNRRPFNLLRWFSAISLVCIFLISSASALLLSRFLSDHMVRHDARVSKELIESVVRAENTWSYFLERDRGRAEAALESFFTHVSRLPDVVRANVYRPDRTVIWSSIPDFIGRRLGPNPELEAAFAGELEVEFGIAGLDGKPEHALFDPANSGMQFVEAYIPIWNSGADQVVGVVEIYKLPRALFAAVADGQRRIWLSAALGGLLLYATLFWIVRRASLVIRDQQTLLVESETMAAIGELASAVAHSIRNPLASIRSSAELVLEEAAEGTREPASDIIAETERMDKWVRDLLIYARHEGAAPELVDINEVLRDSLQGFAQVMERQGVALELDTQEPLPPIKGHVAPLGQAFNNLVANALEAMARGGRLKAVTRREAAGRSIAISLTDDGPGLPADLAAQLFRPFFTTKPGGLGLGLALVRRTVTRHGGTVEFSVGEGRSTTVTVRLPAAVGRKESLDRD